MTLAGKRLGQIIAVAFILFRASVAHGDEVTRWNAILETTVAATPHFLQSRSAAIVQLAVFEAVNAIVGDYEPYLGTIAAAPWASPDAATVAAAHRALVALHPEHLAMLNAERVASLAAIPDGPDKVPELPSVRWLRMPCSPFEPMMAGTQWCPTRRWSVRGTGGRPRLSSAPRHSPSGAR